MKNALVVDDTKLHRTLVAKCLEDEGYTVTTSCRGKDALELLQKESYDLIFLDIKMPFMSGTEILRQIRQKGIATPVVITTAYATVKNAVECTKLGAVAYLQKPFTIKKLKAYIHHIESPDPDNNPFLSGEDKSADFHPIKNEIMGDLPKSFSQIKNRLAEDPANANLYLLLSEAYAKNGSSELAEKFYRVYQVLK